MLDLMNQVTRHLASQSLQIAILVLVVALVTYVLRKRSAHVRYLLWLVVLAKCLVLPMIHVNVPVMHTKTLPVKMMSVPLDIPAAATEAPIDPVVEPISASETLLVDMPVHTSKPNYRLWFGFVWLSGCVLFLLLTWGKVFRIAIKLGQQRKPLTVQQQNIVQQLALALGYKRSIRVWQVNGLAQPFVWGLPRGAIYVPESLWTGYSQSHIQCALAHELNHVMRWDASVNALQILAQAVFWFHPCVWWTNRKLRFERESCCDEGAIAMLNTTSEQYGQAIVATLAASKQNSPLQSSLAITGPLKSIEERLRSIMKPNKQFHKRASFLDVVCILLIALTLVPFAWQPTRVRAASSFESERAAAVKEGLMPIPLGQILFSTRYYLVDKTKNISNDAVAMSVRVDEAYAKQLAELAKEKKGVKCVASPSAISHDGKMCTMAIITEEYFMLNPKKTGEGDSGHESLEMLESGLTLSVVGTIQKGNSKVRLVIETHVSEACSIKDVVNRKTPFEVTNGVKARITTENGKSVVISGMSVPDDPDRFMVVVITPAFTGKMRPLAGSLKAVEKKPETPKAVPAKPTAKSPRMGAVERLTKRTQFIQSDPMVKALSDKMVELELQLLAYSLEMDSNHPSIVGSQKMLKAVQIKFDEQKHRIGLLFDQALDEEMRGNET